MGQNVKFRFRDNQKAHPCVKRRLLGIDRENRHNGLRVTICQNPKTSRVNRGRSKFVNRIVIKFCIAVGIRGVITHANFGGHRFTRFWVAGVEFHIFLLTLDVYLITLWHNRASV